MRGPRFRTSARAGDLDAGSVAPDFALPAQHDQHVARVDRADDAVERAYAGWPDRLYLIDATGRIAYNSAAGPFGFKPDELQAALQRLGV